MLGILNPTQIDQVLRSEVVGHLGCHGDGKIYVAPTSYVYDGACIYGHSADGMKLRLMQTNPHVCFQVEHIDNLATWVSVIAWGEYEEIADEDAKSAMRLFLDRMEPLQASETALSPHRGLAAGGPAINLQGDKAIFFRIRLSERTGRFEKP